MKTKYFKFLSVFVAVIIAFIISCFPVSALEGDLPLDLSGVMDIFAFRMYKLDSNYQPSTQISGSDISIYTRDVKVNGQQALHVSVYVPRYDFSYGANMEIDFKLLYGNSTETQYNDLSFSWVWNKVRGFMGTNRPVFRCERHLAGGEVIQCGFSKNDSYNFYTEPSSNGTDTCRGVDYDFGMSPTGTVTDYYTISWGIGVPSSGAFDFYIINLELDYGDIAARDIMNNQNENTDKLLNAGEDTNQPDFDSTNNALNDTTNQMNALESEYKIDPTATNNTLSSGSAFLSSSDMNKASIQVKSWIEKFSSENTVFTSFIVAALCLGLCFWVIGRKAG